MEVIFVNILREYLELEFKNNLGSIYDERRLIDDFVCFSFLIGNDFLHQMFCMNVRLGNFDMFLRILGKFYKKK